jgi:hypothetical protein
VLLCNTSSKQRLVCGILLCTQRPTEAAALSSSVHMPTFERWCPCPSEFQTLMEIHLIICDLEQPRTGLVSNPQMDGRRKRLHNSSLHLWNATLKADPLGGSFERHEAAVLARLRPGSHANRFLSFLVFTRARICHLQRNCSGIMDSTSLLLA